MALTAADAPSLRVSEVMALKVSDIDSGPMVMGIGHGNGRKECYAMLSAHLLGILRGDRRAPPCICFRPVPGQSDKADRGDRSGRRLPRGDRRCWARQASPPLLESGERLPRHPGSAPSRRPVDDRGRYTCFHASAFSERDAPGQGVGKRDRRSKWPPRRGLLTRQRRASQRRTACDPSGHGLAILI